MPKELGLFGFNDYSHQFLLLSLKANPIFENLLSKMKELKKKIMYFLQFESSAKYYIIKIDNVFSSKKLRDSRSRWIMRLGG